MKWVFTLISFLLVQPGLAQNIDLSSNLDLNNSLFKICIGDCDVLNQPRNPLYNYHDGGFSDDKSKAFMRFKDEETIDQMLKNVENNINIRLEDLESKYQDFNRKIDNQLKNVLNRDIDILEKVKKDILLYDAAYQDNISNISFDLSSDVLNEIAQLNNMNLDLQSISDQLSEWELDLSSNHSIKTYSIEPDGFEFTGFEFREDLY